MTSRTGALPVIAAVAAVALLIAGVVTWRMTFVPIPQSFLVHASHPRRVKCPAGASCLTATATVVLSGTPARTPLGRPQRQHPLLAELLGTASVLLGLVALGTGLRRRRRPTGSSQPADSQT